MPAPEMPLQHAMFGGEPVDNRSRHMKRKDKRRRAPKQAAMFTLKETVEWGTHARPWLKNLPTPRMELEMQDIRTAEEIEVALLREAQALTAPMFGLAQEEDPTPEPHAVPPEVIIRGFRARQRRMKFCK